jgi:hypothetical protein
MNLNKHFARAVVVLGGRRTLKEFESERFMRAHHLHNAEGTRHVTALAHREAGGTWSVTTLIGEAQGKDVMVFRPVESGMVCGDNAGDLGRNLSTAQAMEVLQKFEAAQFSSGMKTDLLDAINPGHYSRYRHALAVQTRRARKDKGPGTPG